VEWDSIPPVVRNEDGVVIGGNWESLGQHLCECGDVIDGLYDHEFVQLDLYPNPVENTLHITSGAGLKTVEIYNVSGERVYINSRVDADFLNLNTEEWNKGMYLVNLRFENDIVLTKKVIKK
jgi:hypothetical protein